MGLIVWASFCNTFASKVQVSGAALVALFGIVVAMQLTMYILAWQFYSLSCLKLSLPDRIAGLFCSCHKTLALGVPLITSIYENSDDGAGLYTIALLIYHPLLIVFGSVFVPRLKAMVAKERKDLEEREMELEDATEEVASMKEDGNTPLDGDRMDRDDEQDGDGGSERVYLGIAMYSLWSLCEDGVCGEDDCEGGGCDD